MLDMQSNFFKIKKLYQAFTVHQKHKWLHTASLQEAEEKVKPAFGYFQGNIQCVQPLFGENKEGTIACKAVKSVNMISQGLPRLTKFSLLMKITF